MAEWRPPLVPCSAQISVAVASHSATFTPRGEWEPFFIDVPSPAAAAAAANRVAASEIHEAPSAEPPRRPKAQRAVALSLPRASFSWPSKVMPAKCAPAWGFSQPLLSPVLESSCAALTDAMRPVRTHWRWM
eukprot:5827949-Pyramimonas_sp.AAC.1